MRLCVCDSGEELSFPPRDTNGNNNNNNDVNNNNTWNYKGEHHMKYISYTK